MDIRKLFLVETKENKVQEVTEHIFIIKRRSKIQRFIRIPKMWIKQYKSLKGVNIKDKLSFMFESARIVMRDYKTIN